MGHILVIHFDDHHHWFEIETKIRSSDLHTTWHPYQTLPHPNNDPNSTTVVSCIRVGLTTLLPLGSGSKLLPHVLFDSGWFSTGGQRFGFRQTLQLSRMSPGRSSSFSVDVIEHIIFPANSHGVLFNYGAAHAVLACTSLKCIPYHPEPGVKF